MRLANNLYKIAPIMTVLLLGMMVIETNAQPDTLWTRTFGGSSFDIGCCVQLTSDGGYAISGLTTSFGVENEDVYFIKTDSDGNQQWYQTYGSIYDDRGVSFQQCSDNGYIIAGSSVPVGAGVWDAYLIKTDSTGHEEWSQYYGGNVADYGYCVQQTSDGGYIMVGSTESYGAGSADVYLIKTDDSGDQEWTQVFGGEYYDEGYYVQQTTDGGYIIAGFINMNLVGDYDAYLIKTDAYGNEQWSQTYGGDSTDRGFCVDQTNDGGYIVTGYTGSYGGWHGDVYLIKTDASGNELWYRNFGGDLFEYGYSVQQTSDSGYIIVGATLSYGAGEDDVYVIKTDASGNEVWTQTFGGSFYDRGNSIQQTSDGGYIIAATTISYGSGLYDVWLIRLAPEVAPDFIVTLTYNSGSPVPAGGGAINFDVSLQNNEASAQNFDLWIEIPPQVTPPSVPNRNFTFPANRSVTVPGMNWPIPAGWPAGNYTMEWNIGDLSTTTSWASDSFPFVKSADDDGSGFALWEVEGDPLDQLFEGVDFGEMVVSDFALLGAYPNPFNPSSTIRYVLPEASRVTLTVFDIDGRQVAELVNGWRDMGVQEAVFDASNLASGVYIYNLNAGTFNATGKMVLMK